MVESFKAILIGNTGVGKTTIARTLDKNQYEGATIGVDYVKLEYDFQNLKVKIDLWDTAGCERFRTMTQSFYRGSHIIYLVYSTKEKETFESLHSWISELKERVDDTTGKIVLIGTKIDKLSHGTEEVSKSDVEAMVQKYKDDILMDFMLDSRDKATVRPIFETIAQYVWLNNTKEDTDDILDKTCTPYSTPLTYKKASKRSFC